MNPNINTTATSPDTGVDGSGNIDLLKNLTAKVTASNDLLNSAGFYKLSLQIKYLTCNLTIHLIKYIHISINYNSINLWP